MFTLHTGAVRVPAIIAALLFAQFLFTSVAFAATDYASSVESYTPGTQKNGAAIAADRDDPNEALGAPDDSFVSLGYGGELVLGFPVAMSGDLSVSVFETTNAPYPLEEAEVAVSANAAGPWTIVGTADNTSDITMLEVAQCFQYVRLVDTTDGDLHNGTSDGFDVDAVEATYDEECAEPEAPEEDPAGDKGDVSIRNSSHTMVLNSTNALANTGRNTAGGSVAGDGGHGGDIMNDGEQDIEGAGTGTGGNGGSSAAGGLITTGTATADAVTRNVVNTTDILVNRCNCDDASHGNVRIATRAKTFLGNETNASASTGDNRARGSRAGSGGNGGSIANANGDDSEEEQEIDDVGTGNGGQGGASDVGGTIQSGDAFSLSTTENITDRIRVRVNR